MCILFILLLFCQVTFANILHVPEDYTSIQAAFDASSNMDTVLVARGTYEELIIGPEHTLTLMSSYAFSQDTLDIQETILDGYDTGTILTVRADDDDRMIVDGFIFQHGLGTHWMEGAAGGGIHLGPNANVTVRNSVFRENACESSGACIRCYNGAERHHEVVLENIAIHDNNPYETGNGESDIRINTYESIRIDGIRFFSQSEQNSGSFSFATEDSLVVNNLSIDGLTGSNFGLEGEEYISVSNLHATSSRLGDVQLFGGHCRFNNLVFDSLEFVNGDEISFFAQYSFQANGISLCNSRSYSTEDYTVARLMSMNLSGTNDLETFGECQGLHVQNNVVGNTTPIEVSTDPKLFSIGNINLHDAVFEGNELILTAADVPNPGQVSAGGPLLQAQYTLGSDTARIRKCRFENNLLVDPDDYSGATSTPNPSVGRSLYVHSLASDLQYLELSDLIFRNNRQPNHCPEIGGDQWWGVSGDMYLDMMTNLEYLSIHDILMEDIDDGGLIAFCFGNVQIDIHNIIMRRVNRLGLWLNPAHQETHGLLSNLFFDTIVEQDFYVGYPYHLSAQDVLQYGRIPARNVTIINCEMTKLLSAPTGFENCVLFNNDYDYLNNPAIQDPYPYEFEYCLSNVEIEGQGNVVAHDFDFHPELGPPYLPEDSPCIDAGAPDTAYNDIEDSSNPGYALWPSQGGLRNDIGFTGGPRAALPDTQWVDLPKLDPEVHLAKSFHLGNPYPNPFNPVTQIPFTLMRPAEIELVIYNLLGRKMTTLVEGSMHVGAHVVPFHGGGLASGMYLAVLQVDGEQVEVRKMMLMK